MTAIEILAEAAGAVRVARDTLKQKERALRGILPPCFALDDPYGSTSKDAADFIYGALYALEDAADILNGLIEAAEAGRLTGDKDKEVR